jgi:hypothetical protein
MNVTGKVVAVGSEDGSVVILDLESSNSVSAMTEEQLPCATLPAGTAE